MDGRARGGHGKAIDYGRSDDPLRAPEPSGRAARWPLADALY